MFLLLKCNMSSYFVQPVISLLLLTKTSITDVMWRVHSVKLETQACHLLSDAYDLMVCVLLLTAVYPDPQFQLLFWSVADLEGPDGIQQGEGHTGDLSAVKIPVLHRQPRHHHVGVADGLHLGAPRNHKQQVSVREDVCSCGFISALLCCCYSA